MTITIASYAFLSFDVYAPQFAVGVDFFTPDNVKFKMLEQSPANSAGYFGAIYQNVATGELVVAHRGTEPADWIKDLLTTDGQMAILAINQQADYAKALVLRAIELAAPYGGAVSITGHSLGGSLAQITAAHYHLHAETFNAYGAANLISSDDTGNDIVNYVRATDIVASAGIQRGEVKIYASELDVDLATPSMFGGNLSDAINAFFLKSTPFGTFGTHTIEQFFGPHSIISDAEAKRYKDNQLWYDLDRATIRAVAMGAVGTLNSLAALSRFMPSLGGFAGDAMVMAQSLLQDSYLTNQSHVLSGTDGVDTRSGTDGVDIFMGGKGNDILSGGSGNDWLFGQDDNDTLRGGSGADHISGGIGDDYLNGGSGNDVLEGGAGNDRYDFLLSDFQAKPGSVDIIDDSDGQGHLEFQSVPVAVGDRLNATTWKSLDGKFLITADLSLLSQTLTIKNIETGSRILVKNWANDVLGIHLGGEVPPVQTGGLTGDDDIFGQTGTNNGNDSLNGLAGNDGMDGGAGNDTLDGGIGNDLILGGSGDDHLYGGDGNDIILDGSEQIDMRPLKTTIDADGKSEQQRFDEELGRRGASVIAKGKSWFAFRTDGGAATGNATLDGDYTIYQPGWTLLDPNVSPSGNDVIDAGAGSDIVASGEGNDLVFGGIGDDTISGGADDDVLYGGDGNDVIDGDLVEGAIAGVNFTALVSNSANKNGNDILDGGEGNDTLRGGGGNDVLYGGNGDDVMFGRGRTGAVDSTDLDADYLDGGAGNDQILGDDGNDTILGGDGNDVIHGDNASSNVRYGNDSIDGGAGDDTIYGDGGDDILIGGDGADTLNGDALTTPGAQQGNDLLDGGAGNDTLFGMGGNDTLYGGEGDDTLVGDADVSQLDAQFHGNDLLFGGAGNDLMWGNGGDDTLDGGDGVDQLSGGTGNDQLYGGAGDDTLFGGDGNDLLRGDDGADVLSGDAGDDTLSGGLGNDKLAGGVGNDTLDGGAGNDTFDGGDGNDTLLGGDGNDAMYGGNGDDVLTGGSGNDVMNGAAGNDIYQFDLGWGADVIQGLDAGDAGQDTIRFGAGIDPAMLVVTVDRTGSLVLKVPNSSDTLALNGFFNNTNAAHRIEFANGIIWTMASLLQRFKPLTGSYNGTAGADIIVGDSTGNAIDGDSGDDILIGGSGDDNIYGGVENGTNFNGSDNDVLMGGDGNDYLSGGEGNDVLDGGTGNDRLYGGYGADTLSGGAGDDALDAGWWESINGLLFQDTSNDTLSGGAGNDKLTGGLGVNTYLFDPGFGNDRLYLTQAGDFEASRNVPSEDAVLRFGVGITASAVSLSRSGNDLIVHSGSDSVTLVNYGNRGSATIEFSFIDGSILDAQQYAVLSDWTGTAAPEVLSGGNGNDTLNGYGGDDTLYGNAGNDALNGGPGLDILYGGTGDDTYTYNLDGGRDFIRGANQGNDTLIFGPGIARSDVTIYRRNANAIDFFIKATGNYVETDWGPAATDKSINLVRFADGTTMTAAEVDAAAIAMPFELNFFDFTSGSRTVTGNQYSNDISSDTAGSRTLIGGAGDDQYYLEGSNFAQLVVENANEGNDTVYTATTKNYTLPDNVENLVAQYSNWIDTETNPRRLTGNALNNIIDASQSTSSYSYNRLDGGAGADVLIGSVQNDTYVVDTPSDLIIEPGDSASIDTVEASFSFSIADLPALENVTLVGTTNTTATGNASANRLDGSQSGGANVLTGGLGDDTYIVGSGDQVVENAGEGSDTVVFETGVAGAFATAGYQNVERFRLGETVNLSSVTGDAANNDLTGNSYDNDLYGGAGADTITDSATAPAYWHTDNDRLFGGDGDDTLISRFGNDELIGGKGNDTLQGNKALIRFSKGDGQDTFVGNGSAGTAQLVFDASIASSDVTFSRDGSSLVVNIGSGGQDKITVQNYWAADGALTAPIQTIAFQSSNGTTTESWDSSNVLGKLYATTLVGGAGDDRLIGGVGDDLLIGNAGNDYLEGGAGNDTLDGGSGNDTYFFDGDFRRDQVLGLGDSTSGVDVIQFGPTYTSSNLTVNVTDAGDLVLTGQNGTPGNQVTVIGFMLPGSPLHQIQLNDGTIWTRTTIRDRLLATTPNDDYVIGLFTDDAIDGLAGNDSIDGRGGNDMIHGGDGNDSLLGGTGDDHLYGDAGSDSLDGGIGADILEGGAGDDSYQINDNLDTIIELAGAGTDSVFSSIDYVLPTNVENLYLSGSALLGTGNLLNNYIGGDDQDNVLDGGMGADILSGGRGNDLYLVDNTSDAINEIAGEGTDSVQSSVTYTLAANVENLTLTGSAAINATGNILDNVLTGNSGNNVLNGGAGNDSMAGAAGNDTYIVNAVGDVVTESANDGVDTVQASVTYALGSNVENLTLTGSAAISGSGNALDNLLTGNSAANTLTGGAGNDTLNGGAGNDSMAGGAGNDAYTVDASGDVVLENANEGTDSVSASVTYTLSNNVENLTLTGAVAINGTGNALNNILLGNSAANALTGGAGNDSLNGGAGNDTLDGGAGNDMLDGGAGNDTLVGGLGDDTYVIDSLSDVVTEVAGQGIDTVRSTVTYTLGANLENLTLIGSGAISGTGNASANRLVGNAANNTLTALAGDDVLDGGAGTDTLVGGTGKDTYLMTRGYGADTVVENDATAGQLDVAQFLTGVSYDQLWFARPASTNNLEITIIGTSDKLVVKDWYLGSAYQVEEIRTADGGRVLTAAKVQSLVTAMAKLAKPALGQTTLPASYRTPLDPVFASTWSAAAPGLRATDAGLGSAQPPRAAHAQELELSSPIAPVGAVDPQTASPRSPMLNRVEPEGGTYAPTFDVASYEDDPLNPNWLGDLVTMPPNRGFVSLDMRQASEPVALVAPQFSTLIEMMSLHLATTSGNGGLEPAGSESVAAANAVGTQTVMPQMQTGHDEGFMSIWGQSTGAGVPMIDPTFGSVATQSPTPRVPLWPGSPSGPSQNTGASGAGLDPRLSDCHNLIQVMAGFRNEERSVEFAHSNMHTHQAFGGTWLTP